MSGPAADRAWPLPDRGPSAILSDDVGDFARLTVRDAQFPSYVGTVTDVRPDRVADLERGLRHDRPLALPNGGMTFVRLRHVDGTVADRFTVVGRNGIGSWRAGWRMTRPASEDPADGR